LNKKLKRNGVERGSRRRREQGEEEEGKDLMEGGEQRVE
jgi:hypothetical protein